MKKKIKKDKNEKVVIALISGSVGELDWNLPILDFLIKENFILKIIFLKCAAYESLKKNILVSQFINKNKNNVKIFRNGGYFIEKIDHFIYIIYRILVKLKLDKLSLINYFFDLLNNIFNQIFYFKKCLNISKTKKYLFLSEFPSFRKPRDIWIRKKFSNSIFLYHPHSPNIYVDDLKQKYQNNENINYSKKHFLLLGHKLDYTKIKKIPGLSSKILEKVFIGHPKWSKEWVNKNRLKLNNKNFNLNKKNKLNILIVSRGPINISEYNYYINLINSTISTIMTEFPNSNLIVKKHPRENIFYWENLAKKYSSIYISNDHLQKLASNVNLAITFLGSGAVDCHQMGIPVIEFCNLSEYKKGGMILKNGSYTTIYRMLNIVIPSNNQQDLKKAIKKIIKEKYKIKFNEVHPFYRELIKLSNTWEYKVRKILKSHKFL